MVAAAESSQAADTSSSHHVKYDLGNLAAFASRTIDPKLLKADREAYLRQCATETTTQLIHEVFALPDAGRPKDGGRLVSLPDTTTPLPREKPVPKPKPQTRWDKFAEKKGIVKQKRSRMVLDEESGEYKPRYGYKSIDKDGLGDAFIAHKESMDLANGNDPFLERAQEKKARVDKNKKQNLQNQRRAMKESLSTVGSTVMDPRVRKTKTQAEAAYDIARTATASVGKFDDQTQAQKRHEPKIRGGKRQFEPVVSAASKSKERTEQQKNLSLLSRMLGKEGAADSVLNRTKAIKSVHDEVGAKDAATKRDMLRDAKINKKIAKKKLRKKKR